MALFDVKIGAPFSLRTAIVRTFGRSVGLFHRTQRQRADIAADTAFHSCPPPPTSLPAVSKAVQQPFSMDLASTSLLFAQRFCLRRKDEKSMRSDRLRPSLCREPDVVLAASFPAGHASFRAPHSQGSYAFPNARQRGVLVVLRSRKPCRIENPAQLDTVSPEPVDLSRVLAPAPS